MQHILIYTNKWNKYLKIGNREIQTLLKLHMVSPASMCDAERSFSALRRLKTWLSNRMTQRRLNAIMICNILKEKLEELDIDDILKSFINNSFEIRSITFGK